MKKIIRIVVSIVLSVIMIMSQAICVNAQWYKTKNGDYYYKDENGKRVTGWKKIGEYFYFFDENGYRYQDCFLIIDDSLYHFSSSGKMTTGWYKGDKTYYFKSNGKIATGWRKINEKHYYFDPDDYHMCTGERYIDGKIYNFNSKGVWNGKAGYKPTDYRKSYWGDSISTVSKKEAIVEGDKATGLYIGKNLVIGDYDYYVYYNFDGKNKLYKGSYLLNDNADNVYDEFSCYLAYNQLVELYTAKYGVPIENDIKYFSSTKDYAKNYLNTWQAVQLGYAYGIAKWKINTTEITIDYYEGSDFTPNVCVTYKSLNYTPSSSDKVKDTSGI